MWKIRLCPIIGKDIGILKTFSCHNSSIDGYLQREAYIDHLKRDASTTLVFAQEELVSYFTLLHRQMEFEEENEYLYEKKNGTKSGDSHLQFKKNTTKKMIQQ